MSSKVLGNLKSTNKKMHSLITKTEIASTSGYKAASEFSAIKLVKVNIVKNGVTIDTFYAYATPRIDDIDIMSSIYSGRPINDYKLIIIDSNVIHMSIKTLSSPINKFKTNGEWQTFGQDGKALVNIRDILINDRSSFVKTLKRIDNLSNLFYDFYENRIPPKKTLGTFVNNKTIQIDEFKDSIERITVLKTIKDILQILKLRTDKSIKLYNKANKGLLSVFKSESGDKKYENELAVKSFIKASDNLSKIMHSINIEIKFYNEFFLANNTIKSKSKSRSE